MKTKTICIIGGTQESTFKKIGKKKGVDVIFHDGNVRKSPESEFASLVRNADAIVVLKDACKHRSMWSVKELCKKFNKPFDFLNGRGATSAIEKGLELISA